MAKDASYEPSFAARAGKPIAGDWRGFMDGIQGDQEFLHKLLGLKRALGKMHQTHIECQVRGMPPADNAATTALLSEHWIPRSPPACCSQRMASKQRTAARSVALCFA